MMLTLNWRERKLPTLVEERVNVIHLAMINGAARRKSEHTHTHTDKPWARRI